MTAIALLISVCLNIVFCLRQRKCEQVPQQIIYPDYAPSYREEEQIDENPIYGNINQDFEAHEDYDCEEECYEQMKAPRKQQTGKKPAAEPSMCYASLDLTVDKKKRKKHKNRQAAQDFLEVETEQTLPSRSSSTMVSRNSIYLNSQQLTEESEEAIHEDPAMIFSKFNKSQSIPQDSM
ncbi:T-cell receptor-associated transmembrane adapter 1 isoform X2 [Lepisosteus oculatus]|nr:PREDICTED: T-cell receptor-associated transmembrane adapter 1-like isoform X2 [Lepisosteus oculatus]